jgi:hypothetical protein
MKTIIDKLLRREVLVGAVLVAILILNWERHYGLSQEIIGQIISALIVGAGWLMAKKEGGGQQ